MWLAGYTHTVASCLDAVPRLIAQAHSHASVCNVVSFMASVGGHGPHESSVRVLNIAICNGVQHITAWHRIGCRGREIGLLLIILLAKWYYSAVALTLAEWSCFIQVSVSQAAPLTGSYQLKASTTVVGDYISV